MDTDPRFCAHCDQEVELLPAGKEWTAGGSSRGEYRHKSMSHIGIPNCGRQFLFEHETYTETYVQL